MCEIQFVMNPNGLSNEEKAVFFKALDNGAVGNGDAWGVYTEIEGTDYLYKNAGKPLNDRHYQTVKDVAFNSNIKFLLGHNRLKTNGSPKDNNNNHPFVGERFVVVHNGSISNHSLIKREENMKYEASVDSYVVLALLEKYKDEYKYIPDLIEFVAGKISGMFSIFVYDKQEKQFYYFKESTTSMYGYMLNKTIFMSTGRDSIELPKINGFFEPNVLQGEPDAETIYQVKPDGRIIKVGTFVEARYYNYNYNRVAKNNYETALIEEAIQTLEENFDIKSIQRDISSAKVFIDKKHSDRHWIEAVLEEYAYEVYYYVTEKRKTFMVELWPIETVYDEEEDEQTKTEIKTLFNGYD